jgi:hypothetical protein
MSTMAWIFLFHHAYDHASNALVRPLSTAVGDIDNNEQRPADGTGRRGGGYDAPPLRKGNVVVVIIDDGSSSRGADNQGPIPYVAKGRPTDSVAAIVVGFPPVVRSPT